MYAVLAGGVGAARFLQGLISVVPQREVAVISNTGDDMEFYGLYVSPDVDIVTYTLAGQVDPGRGFGLLNDTTGVVDALTRFGEERWFGLGDRDLATALYRTHRIAQGATLSDVAAEVARGFGLDVQILPMSDQRVRTRILTPGGPLAFQDYFVRRRTEDEVTGVTFEGIEEAQPGPGVIAALKSADAVIIAPSNPFVSVGPILALPGVRECLQQRRETVIAVSPIVGGTTIKGPAAKMLVSLGYESTARQVAELYRDFAGAYVLDTLDAALAPAVHSLEIRTFVTDSIMSGPYEKAALARATLAAVGRA